jgi:tetratricopeptide (TPR) repeat protein
MRWRTGFIIGLALTASGVAAFGQSPQQIERCVNKNKAYSNEQSMTACVLVGNDYNNHAYDLEEKHDYPGAAADHERAAKLLVRDNTASATHWIAACRDRVAAGQIDQAGKDCDAGLAAWPEYPPGHDARGVIHLRTGAWDKARAEFDTALGVFPNVAFSFYGRGLAKLKLGDIAGGNADMARATTVEPDIANKFATYGVKADAAAVATPPACNPSPGAAAKNLAMISHCEVVYCAQDAALPVRRNLKHIDDMLTELRLRMSSLEASLQKFNRACRAIGGRADAKGPAMDAFRLAVFELGGARSRLDDLYASIQKPPEDNIFTDTSAAMARTYKQPACMREINQQTTAALDEARAILDKSEMHCL